MPRSRHLVTALMASCATFLSVTAHAHWAMPTPTPVDRLIRNLSTHAAAHPDDPKAFYLLGRVHGLAFVLQSDSVGLWGKLPENPEELPHIPDRSFQRNDAALKTVFWTPGKGQTIAPPLDVAESFHHLESSLRAFERAFELDETDAATHLGYAYILNRATHLVTMVDFVPGRTDAPDLEADMISQARVAIQFAARATDWSFEGSAEEWLTAHRAEVIDELLRYRAAPNRAVYDVVRAHIERYWLERAANHYVRAHELSIGEDQTIREKPLRGLRSLVSYESGRSFLRILERFESADGKLAPARVAQRKSVEANLATLDAKPDNRAITPIIMSLDRTRPLSEMLAPDTIVDFDLDGDGVVERWPWIKPDVGFLVWDQLGTGRITSGQQLFGSVTWWMFFDNGYRALDALDDNRDGWIRGAERRHLSVWFDRNSNGISDDGEVTPLTALGIAALRTQATGEEDGCPMARDGVELNDGTRLPTYDWITAPAEK